ncbi:MAG: glycosyltransferase family 2 protein [Nitrospirae bacterium]|nr:glycosyltransferase family 2 protein [Nitrospirota bacterium]
MLLSVVFSFRNESSVIETLVKRVIGALEPLGIDLEIIFVNDDSDDGSLDILMRLRETDKRVKVINMSRRFGVHPCVIAGLKHTKGDAVVYMDADLQDPPELIPKMIEKWKEGADVVNTVRTKRLGENPFRMWLTKKAYQVINAVSDIDLPVNMGDFKLLSRRTVDELLKINEYDPFMRGLVRWVGFRQETVLYTRDARFAGETHFSLLRSTGPTKEFLRGFTSFSTAPLYISLIYGFIISLFSFCYLIVVIIDKFLGTNLPGWTAIMAATLFLGGNILLTNGFLGLYIARIYNQVKNRPLFIVKDKIGFD